MPPAGMAPAGRPIDFATVLSMTAGQNPQVAFARARISEAVARSLRAESLWLPTLRAGANYNKHEGRIQDVAGEVFDTSRIAAYGGLGARGIGSGSPTFPGFLMQFHVADAVFQPQIAGWRAEAFRYSASATTNDELLESALAYLDLLEAMQAQVIIEETVQNSETLAELTASFAAAGQGMQADADRAATLLAVQRNRR
ncbi:MAG: TolC family protein, partial [Pirellulales bacterium]